MIVLGVDPGTLATGYGLIEDRNGSMNVLASGCIKNDGRASMPLRLKRIFDILSEVIETHHPDEFAIETAFYGKNAQSALKLGHARRVLLRRDLSGVLAARGETSDRREWHRFQRAGPVHGDGASEAEKVPPSTRHHRRPGGRHVPSAPPPRRSPHKVRKLEKLPRRPSR